MPNDIEHERRRFRTLTIRQLHVRLARITDVTKLGNFVMVAGEFARQYGIGQRESAEYYHLAGLARDRISFLSSLDPPRRHRGYSPSRAPVAGSPSLSNSGSPYPSEVQTQTESPSISGSWSESLSASPSEAPDQEPLPKKPKKKESTVRVIRFKKGVK